MRAFSGFPPGKVRNASIPEPVFTEIVPLIDDLAELKLTLHVLWRLGQQRGKVRYLRHSDLASDQVLLAGLGEEPTQTLPAAIKRAVERDEQPLPVRHQERAGDPRAGFLEHHNESL